MKMKKLVYSFGIIICLIGLGSYVLKSNEGSGYKLSFKIKGAKDTVYLCRYYGDKRFYQDTALVNENGAFTFENDKALDEGMYFVMLNPSKYFDVIMSKEQHFSIESDTTDLVKYAKIKGSADNNSFFAYQQFYMVQKDRVMDLQARLKKDPSQKAALEVEMKGIDSTMINYIAEFKKNNPNHLFVSILNASEEITLPEAPTLPNGKKDSVFLYRYYKKHYFDNINFNDDRLIRTPVLAPKVDRFFKDIVVSQPDSIIKEMDAFFARLGNAKTTYEYFVRTLTYKYETSEIMGMDAVFVHMGRNYYGKGKCPWANKEVLDKIKERTDILEPLLLGKKAPTLYMTDSVGKYVVSDAIKAKYLVLYFWDSNCGHCQKETPKLFEAYKTKLRAKGVALYCANIEREDKGWLKYIREKQLNTPGWYNVRDSKNHTDFKITYDIYSTPVLYILDENKIIRAKRLGSDQILEFIEQYEKNKK
jgi:hypothetical protein